MRIPTCATVLITAAVTTIAAATEPPTSQPARPPATQPTTQPAAPTTPDPNPAAPGFDAAGSDARAIELADATMVAMGGRAAWDSVRYLAWRFFGRRFHVWDKQTGDIRIEWVDPKGDSRLVLMNVQTKQGRSWHGEHEMTNPFVRDDDLAAAYSMWINDSYWLVMPFKLKDRGVTLTSIGPGVTATGAPAERIDVTFTDVGETPANRYRVYIDQTTHLVAQWDFYVDANDDAPRLSTEWSDWKQYGPIRLSGDRGRAPNLEVHGVYASIPENVMRDPAPVNVAEWTPLEPNGAALAPKESTP